jgi:hypothetical protein
MRKREIIEKNNILLEQKMLLEKIGVEALVNDLTLKIDMLTKKVNNGENLEKELQKNVEKLTSLLNNEALNETELVEGVSNNIRNVLFAAFLALGMTTTQAQEKLDNAINMTSMNQSAETILSDNMKFQLVNNIQIYLKKSNDTKQIVVSITGKASQVTPPKGMTNEELAIKRAEEAKKFIEAKYGSKVIISSINIKIGKTKYQQGVDDVLDAKYTKEQGVDVTLNAYFGKNLVGEFNSLLINTGNNPDNICVYDTNNNLIHSTGFFGGGDKYHPNYLLRTTQAIIKNSLLAKYNEKFSGTIDELKSLLTAPINDKDVYYYNALRSLENLYNSGKPIYLYKLTDEMSVNLEGKGLVIVKAVVNDKDTSGDIKIRDKNNKLINANYDNQGFSVGMKGF